jgi:predicted GIY-YIG superfamily endonuclease
MWHYVYSLQTQDKQHWYVGVTNDIHRRLEEHNSGLSKYTSKHLAEYNLWELYSCTIFKDRKKAEDFEQYLKTQSGRRFAKRFL